MKTTTLPLKNLRNRSSCQVALVLILSVLASFALAPQARAVCQEGCLTNNNTVLGEDALVNNTGVFNTAIGVDTSNSTQLAAQTRRSALTRSNSTQPAARMRQLAIPRSLATQPATSIRPRVIMRSLVIQLATTTRPPVVIPSGSAQPALRTQPSVMTRSFRTRLAAAISQPVLVCSVGLSQ